VHRIGSGEHAFVYALAKAQMIINDAFPAIPESPSNEQLVCQAFIDAADAARGRCKSFPFEQMTLPKDPSCNASAWQAGSDIALCASRPEYSLVESFIAGLLKGDSVSNLNNLRFWCLQAINKRFRESAEKSK